VPGSAKPVKNRRSIITPPDIFRLSFGSSAKIDIFEGTYAAVARWWREMKGVVGGTKFTRLGLTIKNTIGKFLGFSILSNHSS